MESLKNLDKQLLKWIYQKPFKHSILIKVLIFTGDGPFWMLLVFISALIGQIFDNNAYYRLAILLMLGLSLGSMLFTQLKIRIKRRRPYANLELQEELKLIIENRDPGHASKEMESFPSGHVFWTTICVTIICYQFGVPALISIGWMIPVMILLRPYLGVHYPSDVLSGLFLGCLNALITIITGLKLIEILNSWHHYPVFPFGYWGFIVLFLYSGFKSWRKRV